MRPPVPPTDDAKRPTVQAGPRSARVALPDRVAVADPATLRRRTATGLLLSVVAALMYTAANVALRQLADRKDFDFAIFVTGCKGIVPAAVAWVWIAWGKARGLSLLPARRYVPPLLLAAVCTQFVGNVILQYVFALGGLAIVVPIVFAMIILTSAALGFFVLGEPITTLLAAAIGVLIAAIFVLSVGTGDSAAAVAGGGPAASTTMVVSLSILSGIGYGVTGVMIRLARLGGVSPPGSLVLINTTGVVVLGSLGFARLGPSGVAAIETAQFGWMFAASLCTAVAFFALTYSYQVLPVVRVNLINSSQAAMAAIVGVLLFGEPATAWLVYGTLLTLAGLTIVAYARESAGERSDEGAASAGPQTVPVGD